MRLSSTALILAAAMLLAVDCERRTAVSASADSVRIVPDEVSCRLCEIDRYLVVTLTDSLYQAGAFVGQSAQVHVNSRRGFVVSGLHTGLYLSDSSGRVVGQIGRKGDGPGEYRSADFVYATESNYLVLDSRLRRITTLSKADLSVQSTIPMPGWSRMSYAFFPDGRYVFSARLDADPDRYLLHFVGPAGELLRSFGERHPDDRLLRTRVYERYVALSGDSAVWIAFSSRQYRIEQWDTAGNLLKVLERHPPWFPAVDSQTWKYAPSLGKGRPAILAVHEDADGLLWIHALVRRPNYEPPPGEFYTDAFFNVIEVIDPGAGRLVASKWFRTPLGHPGTGGFYQTTYRVAESGEPLFDVWGFRLVRPSSQ